MTIEKTVHECPERLHEYATQARIRRREELMRRFSDSVDRIERAYLELEEAYRRHGVTRTK
ncbi:MAG TPA: hypothetical protein VGM20_08870 [Gemmatimonadales bacterium]